MFFENGEVRVTSYQNEELILAVEQMRLRTSDHTWLTPVRFGECAIPSFDLSTGRGLESLQRIDLICGSRELGIPCLDGALLGILHARGKSLDPGPVALVDPGPGTALMLRLPGSAADKRGSGSQVGPGFQDISSGPQHGEWESRVPGRVAREYAVDARGALGVQLGTGDTQRNNFCGRAWSAEPDGADR